MMEDKPILFFRNIKSPGKLSIFATLKDAKDLIAKNKKPYLRLVLIDPFGQEILVQIWGNHDLYAPLDMFMRKNVLTFDGPIHLINLSYDGEFYGSTKETVIDAIPTQHPIHEKYLQLSEYRTYRTIPNNTAILAEIKKLLNIKPLTETILAKLEYYNVPATNDLRIEITKMLIDKTYTGTIYLIDGNPQLAITEEYTNYLSRQIDNLLEAFKFELADDPMNLIIIFHRLRKDLISLYEYTKLHQNKEN